MKKVSIIGATGYAGAELLRILHNHPEAEVVHITSESHAGEAISDIYPHLKGIYDQQLMSMKDIELIGQDSDFVFIGLPHGHAMKVGKALENMPVRIIDLGADYRFTDTDVYEAWYKVPHIHKDAPRVYGLAELYREQIRDAKIIGNAGCYTTASILALAPLAKHHLIEVDTIVVDAKPTAYYKAVPVENPVKDTAYKFALVQANLGKTLYFTGEMEGNYLATSDKADKAVDVFLEEAEGGYKLYFMNGETKTYIEVYEYTEGKVGVQLTESATNVYTWDADMHILLTHLLDTDYYLGTYKSFETMSASKTSFITGDNAANVGVTQFLSYLVEIK